MSGIVAQEPRPVTIFAAASMKTALEAIAADWESDPTRPPLRFSFAGSSTLARQIQSGAPADLFISASPEWVEALGTSDQIVPDSVQNVAQNRLVLIAHDSSPPSLDDLSADTDFPTLLGSDRVAMAFVDSVPAGQYGKAALQSLGWWEAVAPRVVQTDNVRAALTLVARGDAGFGIVYASDIAALRESSVTTIGVFPSHSHDPILYPVALTQTGAQVPGAAALLAYLTSPQAQQRFVEAGFGTELRAALARAPDTEGAAWWALTDAEWTALSLSLKVSFWATLLTLPLGLLVAFALARWDFWGKQALNGLVHLPLILPPVVTGYGLLVLFGRQGPVGQALSDWFGISVVFEWTGAVLAAAVMAFPLMVRAMRLAIEAVDPKLEQAARTLGASRAWTFAVVTLPMVLPGIITGAILAFAKAMGEFGATITFVSNIPGETQTLPSAIYAFLQVPDGETPVYRMVVASIAVAIGALLISEWVSTKVARRISGR